VTEKSPVHLQALGAVVYCGSAIVFDQLSVNFKQEGDLPSSGRTAATEGRFRASY
jgi:hypothetical protein